MIRSGVISLYDRADNFITSKKYETPGERKAVINAWRKSYSKMFDSCSLRILPDAREEEVSSNGENMRLGERRKLGIGIQPHILHYNRKKPPKKDHYK